MSRLLVSGKRGLRNSGSMVASISYPSSLLPGGLTKGPRVLFRSQGRDYCCVLGVGLLLFFAGLGLTIEIRDSRGFTKLNLAFPLDLGSIDVASLPILVLRSGPSIACSVCPSLYSLSIRRPWRTTCTGCGCNSRAMYLSSGQVLVAEVGVEPR